MNDIVRLLLPWERLLWHQRARSLARTHYALTDFRVIRTSEAGVVEIALHDIGDVQRSESTTDRMLGTSTVVVNARGGRSSIAMTRVTGGAQLAGLLEWIADDPESVLDPTTVRAALAWIPRSPTTSMREPLIGLAVVFAVVGAFAIGLHDQQVPVIYSSAETLSPSGHKRERQDIERFMETDVIPWARAVLGPVVGGEARVSCATCHRRDAVARNWRMPSVVRLPEPILATRGWERYSRGMDPQMRNAVYGYLAESDKQATAGYMREVVMPGMARLLGRPPYDFTKSYEHNRTRHAFGCYHCHSMDDTTLARDERQH